MAKKYIRRPYAQRRKRLYHLLNDATKTVVSAHYKVEAALRVLVGMRQNHDRVLPGMPFTFRVVKCGPNTYEYEEAAKGREIIFSTGESIYDVKEVETIENPYGAVIFACCGQPIKARHSYSCPKYTPEGNRKL